MTVRLPIKVVPRASQAGIVECLGEALNVRVRVLAEKGRANAAVAGTIAATLSIPTWDGQIVREHTSEQH